MRIYKEHFGKKLRQARKSLGLRQSDLAEAVGVEPSTVSRWETGEDSPDDVRLPTICKTLKVSPDYFVDAPNPTTIGDLASGDAKRIIEILEQRLPPKNIKSPSAPYGDVPEILQEKWVDLEPGTQKMILYLVTKDLKYLHGFSEKAKSSLTSFLKSLGG
ncbi:MAG: helix-turn-helix domain-containing protein [Pseudobdellovibrionaceae bacterium]